MYPIIIFFASILRSTKFSKVGCRFSIWGCECGFLSMQNIWVAYRSYWRKWSNYIYSMAVYMYIRKEGAQYISSERTLRELEVTYHLLENNRMRVFPVQQILASSPDYFQYRGYIYYSHPDSVFCKMNWPLTSTFDVQVAKRTNMPLWGKVLYP